MEYKQFDFGTKVLHHPDHIQRYLDNLRPVPINVEIDLTNACNHRCSFCVFATYIGEVRATLPIEIVMRTLNELKVLGTKSINWTGGGEPTLHKGFYQALDHSYNLGLENGLITNCSQIKDQHDNQLLDQLVWTRVSMAGGTRETYREIQGADDFDKVVDNLKRIESKRAERASKMNLGIAMLVKPGNLFSVMAMIELAIEVGVDYVQLRADQFISAPERVWWQKQAMPLIKKAEEVAADANLQILGATYIDTQKDLDYPEKCYAHHFVLGINAEGYVAFCKNTRDNPQFLIGDLRKQTFTDIWETSIKNRELESSIRPANCATFCKNMGINKAIHDVIQGDITIPLEASDAPETLNFL